MKRFIASLVAAVKSGRTQTQDLYWTLVNTPFGNWIPAPNVLTGVVTAGLITAARELGVAEFLPAGWSEAAAGALVTYWVGPPKFQGSLTLSPPTIEEAVVLEEFGDPNVPPATQDTGLVD